MRTAQGGQPSGGRIQRLPGPDGAHRHGQPAPRRPGEMRAGGGDDADPEARGQRGQRRVAFVVERLAVPGQLDADPRRAEPVHQIGQRPRRRVRPAVGKRLAHMAFAATGQDVPVPAGGLGQRVEIVAGLALLAAGQMRRGQLPRQPPVPLGAAGQHQQVRAGRVGRLGARAGAQRQFGAEHGAHVEFGRRLGEPHRPVQPVVVGERQGAQVQPGGLLDHLLGRARPVQEAERGMRVQFGIGNRRTGRPALVGRPVRRAPARQRAVWFRGGRLAGAARLAVEHPLHLRPTRRPVEPAHGPEYIELVFDLIAARYNRC